MTRAILLLLFLAPSLVARPAFCPPKDPDQRTTPRERQTAPTSIPQVVKIKTDCGSCTGWVLQPGIFITAAHCFNAQHTFIKATFEDGHESDLSLAKLGNILFEESQDFAILKGDTHGVLGIEPEVTDGKTPAPCASLGYGVEHKQKASQCFGGLSLRDGRRVFYGRIDFGDSGGPIINKAGHVIGINVQILSDVSKPVFFAVPIDNILKALAK